VWHASRVAIYNPVPAANRQALDSEIDNEKCGVTRQYLAMFVRDEGMLNSVDMESAHN